MKNIFEYVCNFFPANQNLCLYDVELATTSKIRVLKSFIDVQLPNNKGNLKKGLYSCLCVSFVSCYNVLIEKMGENGSFITTAHFSRFQVGSLLASFRCSKVWPGRLLQGIVTCVLISVTKWCIVGYCEISEMEIMLQITDHTLNSLKRSHVSHSQSMGYTLSEFTSGAEDRPFYKGTTLFM